MPVILIAVGLIALAQRLGFISGSIWSYTWPVVLILLGLSMLRGWRARRRGHGAGGWGCCPRCAPHQEDEQKR